MDIRRLPLRAVAAFGAGIALWEAILHASLLANRLTPRLFGIRLSPRLNAIQVVVPGLISVLLARYAFSPRRRVASSR